MHQYFIITSVKTFIAHCMHFIFSSLHDQSMTLFFCSVQWPSGLKKQLPTICHFNLPKFPFIMFICCILLNGVRYGSPVVHNTTTLKKANILKFNDCYYLNVKLGLLKSTQFEGAEKWHPHRSGPSQTRVWIKMNFHYMRIFFFFKKNACSFIGTHVKDIGLTISEHCFHAFGLVMFSLKLEPYSIVFSPGISSSKHLMSNDWSYCWG